MNLLEAIVEISRQGLHTWTLSTPDGGLSIERHCYMYRDVCRAHELTLKAGPEMRTYSHGMSDEALIYIGHMLDHVEPEILTQAAASTKWTVEGVKRDVIVAEIEARKAERAKKAARRKQKRTPVA